MKSNFKFEKNNHWPGKFDRNDCKNILQWNTITDDTERRAIKTVNFPLKTTLSHDGKKILGGLKWQLSQSTVTFKATEVLVLKIRTQRGHYKVIRGSRYQMKIVSSQLCQVVTAGRLYSRDWSGQKLSSASALCWWLVVTTDHLRPGQRQQQ